METASIPHIAMHASTEEMGRTQQEAHRHQPQMEINAPSFPRSYLFKSIVPLIVFCRASTASAMHPSTSDT